MKRPYTEKNSNSYIVRTFSKHIPDIELKWHTDLETRLVEPLNDNDWYFQFDNELPIKMIKNKIIIVPKGTYHRVIKGTTDLEVKIIKNCVNKINLNNIQIYAAK